MVIVGSKVVLCGDSGFKGHSVLLMESKVMT